MMRMPAVAGMFYEAEPIACRKHVRELFRSADEIAHGQASAQAPAGCVGGLVPHAGWVYSGAVAALTLQALADDEFGGTFVLLGAIHAASGAKAMVDSADSWRTPLGDIPIDKDLAAALVDASADIVFDADAHTREHSLEVQAPLIQMLCPRASILPILVPPSPVAADAGRQIGRILKPRSGDVRVVGSTDLTHYGPRYGITPAGVGPQGLQWATANDQRLLKLIEGLQQDKIVADTASTHSACGGGAIAATIAACRELGATTGTVLRHTNSSQVLAAHGQRDTANAVGYASVVFS